MRSVTAQELAITTITHFEGRIPYVYEDPAGVPTGGVGHVIQPEDNLRVGDRVRQELIDEWLARDVHEATEAVDKLVRLQLPIPCRAALISWTFNLGFGNLERSTMLQRINAGYWHEVADEMRRWHYAGGRPLNGLKRRRDAEAGLWHWGYSMAQPYWRPYG